MTDTPKKTPPTCHKVWPLMISVSMVCLVLLSLFFYQKTQTRLTEVTQTLQQLKQQQQRQLLSLKRFMPKETEAWRIAEVAYLIQLAQYNTATAYRPTIATALLTSAKQQLQKITNPALNVTRQRLNKALNQLNATVFPSTTELLHTLTALDQQVNHLPFIFKIRSIEPETKKVAAPQHWQGYWHYSLARLESLIVVRHQTEAISPMIAPNQQAYLLQHLQALLLQARLAVLMQQQESYNTALTTLDKLIHHYVKRQTKTTSLFLSDVAKLRTQTLKPTLPNLTALRQAITTAQTQAQG